MDSESRCADCVPSSKCDLNHGNAVIAKTQIILVIGAIELQYHGQQYQMLQLTQELPIERAKPFTKHPINLTKKIERHLMALLITCSPRLSEPCFNRF